MCYVYVANGFFPYVLPSVHSHTISAGRFFRCDVLDARLTRALMRQLMTLDETSLRIRNDAVDGDVLDLVVEEL